MKEIYRRHTGHLQSHYEYNWTACHRKTFIIYWKVEVNLKFFLFKVLPCELVGFVF